jgi:hypothetical protein
MSERIKQLMQQAGTDTSGKWMGVDRAEKFAELIVRECAGLMDGRRVEYGNCKDGRVILKHFGVEE